MGIVYTRPSSCSEDAKITLDNTIMVATKTLKNVITPRTAMGVAADDGLLALVYGQNDSGAVVPNIDILDRGGRYYTLTGNWRLMHPGVVLYDHRLIILGGVNSQGVADNMTVKYPLREAIVGELSESRQLMHKLQAPRYAPNVVVCDNKIITLGGVKSDMSPAYEVDSHTILNAGETNTDGYTTLERLDLGRSFAGCNTINNKGFIIAGGVDLANEVVYNSVEFYGFESNGNVSHMPLESLAVSQLSPLAVKLYSYGTSYVLIGLGKTLPTSQSAHVVPNIDVYVSAAGGNTGLSQIQTSRYETFTLPLNGNPTSAIGFSFGDCVLFIVGYGDGVTKNKGYLVRKNFRATYVETMEFNFSRDNMQGGVIGNDIAYIAGGTKNGQSTGDVEMIQVLRNMPIYSGMKYKLGSMTSEETASSLTLHPLNDGYKLSGYMKL